MLESQNFLIPSIIEKTSQEFFQELEEFYAENRFHPGPFPRIFGELLDLKSLYLKVQNYGGSNRVTYSNKWTEIAISFGIKFNTLNISNALKDIYQRFLEVYERNQKLDYGQNNESEYTQANTKFSSTAFRTKPSKICQIDELLDIEKQLLSGHDNEINFALNNLLILSSSEKVFRMSSNPRLHLILLEIIGSCCSNSCHENLTEVKKVNFIFWERILSFKGCSIRISQPISSRNSDYSFNTTSDEYEVFELRLYQILTIFRNVIAVESSYDRIELGRCSCLIRFILMNCYSNKHKLSNLAMETIAFLNIPLINEEIETLYFNLIEDCLASSDRFSIKCALQLISNLSQAPINIKSSSFACIYNNRIDRNMSFFNRLVDSKKIIENIVSFLCLEDIEVLVNTLNAVYSITSKGKFACQQVASNHNLWNYLKYLIFLKAQSLSKIINKNLSVYQGSCQNAVYRFPSQSRNPRQIIRPNTSTEKNSENSFQYFGNIMHAPMPARPHIPIPVLDEAVYSPNLVDLAPSSYKANPHLPISKKNLNGFPIQGIPDTSFDISSPKDNSDLFTEHWIRKNFIYDPKAMYDSHQLFSEFVLAHKINLPQINCLNRLEFLRILKRIMNNVNVDDNAQFFHIKCVTHNVSPEKLLDYSSPPAKKAKRSNFTESTDNSKNIISNGFPVNNLPQHLTNGHSHHGSSSAYSSPYKGHALPMNNVEYPQKSVTINGNCDNNKIFGLAGKNGISTDTNQFRRGDANNNSDNNLANNHKPVNEIMAYQCKWTNCNLRNHENAVFGTANHLSSHVYNTHFLSVKDEKLVYCPWQGCPDGSIERTPISLLSHLSDRHYRPELTRIIENSSLPKQSLPNGNNNHYESNNDSSILNNHNNSKTITTENGFKKHPYLYDNQERSNIVTTNHFNKTVRLPDEPNIVREYFTNSTGRDFKSKTQNFQSSKSIRTFANHYEGPVTKHIRHMALLILKNLVQFCPNYVISKITAIEEALCSIISSQIDSIELASECLSLLHSQSQSIR